MGGIHITKKYIYKNKIPKKLLHDKGRRSASSQRKEHQPLKKSSFTLKSQTKYQPQAASWKLPATLLVFSLFMLILIIPTIIVGPFVKESKTVQDVPYEEKEVVIKEGSSPVSVAVMRHQSSEITKVPLEEYVIGVVAAEMGADFEMEALKAQGIAARTYIVNHLLTKANQENVSVSDTTSDQVYKDEAELRKAWGSSYQEKLRKLTDAVYATEGEIITYKDAPIFPAYFSTSNGFTENSEEYWGNELPYLRSVKSEWDEVSPKFLDQKTYTTEEVAQKLNVELPVSAPIALEITRTQSERVSELKIEGHSFTGREIREKLDLQSSDFRIEQNKGHLIFTTKGFGHGIGMSQYGANEMAKAGKEYHEIIKYYYSDVEISPLNETVPTLVTK